MLEWVKGRMLPARGRDDDEIVVAFFFTIFEHFEVARRFNMMLFGCHASFGQLGQRRGQLK